VHLAFIATTVVSPVTARLTGRQAHLHRCATPHGLTASCASATRDVARMCALMQLGRPEPRRPPSVMRVSGWESLRAGSLLRQREATPGDSAAPTGTSSQALVS